MKKIYINEKITKKLKYTLIPVAMSMVIVLSGCGNQKKVNNDEVILGSYYSVEQDIENVDQSEHQLQKTNDYVENTPIKFGSANYLNFNNYLNSLKITYDYSDLYNFKEALNEYNKLNFVSTHNEKISDLTAEKLYNIVLNNNIEFKKTNNTKLYQELSESDLRNVCTTIVNTVNDYIKNNNDISKERINCVLSDLKIFEQRSVTANAYVAYDNFLVISPNMMDISEILMGENKENDIMIHETIHLLQKGCNCDLEKNKNLEQNYGICYKFKNLELNSLKFSWLYESSAEKSRVNYNGNEIITYPVMISYLESLSLTNLPNEKYHVNDTENLSFKRGLDNLFEYFNVTTEEEKIEILNLMYSIEIMQQEPSDFYRKYKEVYGQEKIDDLRDAINYNVKSSICQTLSKIFYRNLSTVITNKENVTIEDIFYLICLFENDMNNHILYNDSTKYDINSKFINTYVEIQDNFFYELSKCLNIKQENVEYMFNNYSAREVTQDGTIVKNYDLKFLNDEKIKYLEERQKKLTTETDIPIRETLKQQNKTNVYK